VVSRASRVKRASARKRAIERKQSPRIWYLRRTGTRPKSHMPVRWPYVPCCQEARYATCSGVSVSMRTPSASSFRRAMAASTGAGMA